MRDKTSRHTSLLPRLVSRFCAVAQPSHSHTPPPTGHQPPQTHGPAGSGLATMGQRGVSCLAVRGLPRRVSIPRRLLGAVYLHGPRPKRRQRRSLLGRLLLRHPRDPPPRLFQPDPGGGTPQPQVPPVATFFPFQNFFSSESPSLQGIGSSRSGGIFRTRYPPILRRSQDFLSASRARRRMSISSVHRDGEGGQSVGAGRATSRPYWRGLVC